jgi:very-short-patch-repair endonuclease
MRSRQTPMEYKLWYRLKSSQLGGFKFRRQIVLEPYIVDFFCSSIALAIEVDGDTHDPAADAARDINLKRRGFTVMRFTNAEVHDNIEGVLKTILEKARSMPPRFTHPPTPSLEREGEE